MDSLAGEAAGDLEDTNRRTHSNRAHGTGQIHTGVSVNTLYNVMYNVTLCCLMYSLCCHA